MERRIPMVTKSKQKSKQEKDKGRVKVGKLKLNKETVKNLTASNQKRIRGGLAANEPWDGGTGMFCTGSCPGRETMTCLIVSQCGRCR
jgi:hypothetical protein